MSPFAVFPAARAITKHMEAQNEAARAGQIAELPRTRIVGAAPRTLEVHGWLPPVLAGQLLALQAFDSIDVIERTRPSVSAGRTWTFKSTAECAGLARRQRDRTATDSEFRDLENCLVEAQLGEASSGSAVVLLTDQHSTLRRSNQLWAGSVFELRLRQDGRDELLDYWEDPTPLHERAAMPIGTKDYPRIDALNRQPKTFDQVTFILRAIGRS
jgi:hypothetical protein